jgi:hypothetical protein
MKKFNNKQDQKVANEAFLIMLVIFCVTIVVNYVTN